MQPTACYLLYFLIFEVLDLRWRISVGLVILTCLTLWAPTIQLLILVDGNWVLVACWELDDILQILYGHRLPHHFWCFGTETKLSWIIVSPRVHVAMDSDRQSMWISATYFPDKFIFKSRDYPWIMYLLCHSLLGQMCKWVMPELSLCIRTPRIQNSMYISLVDASIFSVDDRWVSTQMLRFRTLLPETLATRADHTALDTQTQAVLALLFLKALRTAPWWDHLRSLEEYCLLYLVVVPLLTRLIHDHVVFHQPGLQYFLVNCRVQYVSEHLAQEFIHLLRVSRELVALLQKQILNALSIDWPVGEWNFRNCETVFWEVLVHILSDRAQHGIHRFCETMIIILTLFIVKLQIYIADVCFKEGVQVLLIPRLETLDMRLAILGHVLLHLWCMLTPEVLLLLLCFQKSLTLIGLTHTGNISSCIWSCLEASSVRNIRGLELHLLSWLHASWCIGLEHLFGVPDLIEILGSSVLLDVELVAPLMFSIHLFLKGRDLIHHVVDIAVDLSTSRSIWLLPLHASYCALFVQIAQEVLLIQLVLLNNDSIEFLILMISEMNFVIYQIT